MMEKEKAINLIAGRITDEYRKHHSSIQSWPNIAAAKIYDQWNEYYQNRIDQLEKESMKHLEMSIESSSQNLELKKLIQKLKGEKKKEYLRAQRLVTEVQKLQTKNDQK